MAKLQTLKPRLKTLGVKSPTLTRAKDSWRDGKTTAERGYGSKWQTYRKRFLMNNPLCEYCLEQNRITAATVVDHIEPHRGDEDLFWNTDNHQSLCTPCHSSVKQREENNGKNPYAYVFMPEWLKPVTRLTIVFGPPGSGKSTWVREQATEHDVVLDLDEMISNASGKPLYKGNKQDYALAVRKRNDLLIEMSIQNKSGYLTLTGMKQSQRKWWEQKLMPKAVHIMDTPINECIDRIMNDERRTMSVKQQQILALKNWES